MKFEIGKFMCTAAVNVALREPGSTFEREVFSAFQDYCSGDWGMSGKEDWAANDEAIKLGNRIFAAYETSKGKI